MASSFVLAPPPIEIGANNTKSAYADFATRATISLVGGAGTEQISRSRIHVI